MRVIKLGGHAMNGDFSWAKEISTRWKAGEHFVIVPGGGPQIDSQLKIEGIETEFKDGFRITTPAVMKVVESVLTGSVLRAVVRALKNVGIPAVGITGSDGGLLRVSIKGDGSLGLVGVVNDVEPRLLRTLIDSGYLPVVAPVSSSEDGTALNVNADLAAGAIAGALRAEEALFMTDVPGIYREWPNKESLISEISISELKDMSFTDGMVPKVSALINAVSAGAKSARVFDGRSLAAFQEALSGRGGTWVRA